MGRRERSQWLAAEFLEKMKARIIIHCCDVKRLIIKKGILIMKFENSVIINRPVNKVFEFITDLNNNPIWQTDILELAMTSGGRFGLGSTYRCVNRFMGKRIETEGMITGYEPDRACFF